MRTLSRDLPGAAAPQRRSLARWTALSHSLSAKLVALMVLFMILAGLLVQAPSVARYRMACLADSVADGYRLAMALGTNPSAGPEQIRALLDHARLLGVQVGGGQAAWTLGVTPQPQAWYRLEEQSTPGLLWDALATFFRAQGRIVAVQDRTGGQTVTVYLDEDQIYNDVSIYAVRVLLYALGISLALAALLYLCLQWLMVGSIRCITHSLRNFRSNPESTGIVVRNCARNDEIGFIEAELGRMQRELRGALVQQQRLAALGAAVSRINHDFKSILSTVSIASGRLAKVDDPTVRRIAPLLVSSVERAVHLCTQAQDLARGEQVVPERSRFRLAGLVEEVGEALNSANEDLRWIVEVPEALTVEADRERMYRVLLNLGHNAVQALGGQGTVWVAARHRESVIEIDVCDDGSGIPEDRRRNLFQPFAGSARQGGVGLGLVTARDLVRAHGGELELLESGPRGTCFRIILLERA